jgi:hypothetical protein
MKKLTRKEILAMFKEEVLPYIKEQYEKDGKVDRIARREAFNNFTDSLFKDGMITEKTYNEYNPF